MIEEIGRDLVIVGASATQEKRSVGVVSADRGGVGTDGSGQHVALQLRWFGLENWIDSSLRRRFLVDSLLFFCGVCFARRVQMHPFFVLSSFLYF